MFFPPEFRGVFSPGKICILYQNSVFFAQNHIEFGVSHYLAPVYMMGGGYVQVTPATFLTLRAEFHGLGIWTIDVPAAGYFAVSGYDQHWGQSALGEQEGGATTGWKREAPAARPRAPKRMMSCKYGCGKQLHANGHGTGMHYRACPHARLGALVAAASASGELGPARPVAQRAGY